MHSYRHTTLTLLIAGCSSLPLHAMDITTCGDQVILSGKVDGNEVERLKEIYSKNPALKVAVLRNSPGGNADAGYRAGAFFRENGIATYVSGYCRSSCSRFFLGGAERYFTDDYPAGETHVGFHSNYKENGDIVPGAPAKLKQFIDKYSGGKADEKLVERWINLQNRKGFAYFFHPKALKREDGLSVVLCQGNEYSSDRWRQCEKITGHDALSTGVVTGLEIKHSCDAKNLPPIEMGGPLERRRR